MADERECRHLYPAPHAIEPLDVQRAVRCALLTQGDHERQPGGVHASAMLVHRLEALRPLVHRQRPGVLEPLPEHGLSGLVVVKQIARRADEKRRNAQAAGKLPEKNQLYVNLRHARLGGEDAPGDPPKRIAWKV